MSVWPSTMTRRIGIPIPPTLCGHMQSDVTPKCRTWMYDAVVVCPVHGLICAVIYS